MTTITSPETTSIFPTDTIESDYQFRHRLKCVGVSGIRKAHSRNTKTKNLNARSVGRVSEA